MAATPWTQNLPQPGGVNTAWGYSSNSGGSWATPAPSTAGQVIGGVGVQRWRQLHTVPAGASGTWTVTVSGDIYDNSVNTAAQVWYDGVNLGNVTPLPGPATFTLPMSPGAHTFELRIGGSDDAGVTAPVVSFDFSAAVDSDEPLCQCFILGPGQ
jgi:hypothetical protein